MIAALSDGGVVRIVPENEATRDSNASFNNASIATKIFTLKNRIESKAMIDNLNKCPECDFYFPMTSIERINFLTDENSFKKIKVKLHNVNPLGFDGYPEKVQNLKDTTGLDEAVNVGVAKIRGRKVVIGVMEHSFLLGSLSSQVGKILVEGFDYATDKKLPFKAGNPIIF